MIECVTTTTVAQCVQSSGPGGVLLSVIVVVGRWLLSGGHVRWQSDTSGQSDSTCACPQHYNNQA